MKKIAVVALGGNALLRENEIGTIEQQEANTTESTSRVISGQSQLAPGHL
jgi:carbamate kinase